MPEKEYDIEKIRCSSALNKLKRKIPYGWDLNIYRGCRHGCKYCYAIYSHEYLGEEDFSKVFAKINIAEHLEKELSKPSWKREVVNIGGVTDSYQPAEKDLNIMPDILRILIKYKTPAIISTKSDLILRDYDLIGELAELTYVNVASSIITVNEELRKKLEPGSSTTESRFSVLKEFRKTNASTGLHVMPIIPYFTDDPENIRALVIGAKEANVHYMLPGVMYLRGKTRKVFFDFIRQTFPDKYDMLVDLYKKGGADKDYKAKLYNEIVNPLREKYGVSSSYMKPMREKMK